MITIENIIKTLKEQGVSDDKIEEINKSFLLASEIHKDQYRQSGEPYITHPLNVAKNLLDMEVYDTDAICAALLHDTIEDAKDDFSKEDIKRIINEDVAELVDGVTKMRRINFVTKESQRLANTRKITNGLSKDVRIILIKLADRKHNMETLEFKRPEKQQENAIETMELFVPLALSIGAYKIKSELEDLSLMYIEPDDFKKITEEKKKIEEQKKEYLEEMKIPTYEDTCTRNPIRFSNCGGYTFANTYIEYLESTYGWSKVLELIETENYGQVFGKSSEEIYDEWVLYLNNYS